MYRGRQVVEIKPVEIKLQKDMKSDEPELSQRTFSNSFRFSVLVFNRKIFTDANIIKGCGYEMSVHKDTDKSVRQNYLFSDLKRTGLCTLNVSLHAVLFSIN